MAVNNVFTIGSIVLSGTPSMNLDGIKSSSSSIGAQLLMSKAAGQADNTHVAIIEQRPTITWTTTDISTALNGFGISGVGVVSGAVSSVDMFLTKMSEGGVRASGSVNGRIRAVQGLIVPRQITVSQGQAAELTCELIVTYDGTNNPLAYSFSQALPHTPSIDELFTMGPISFNGTTLAGCQSLTIDFGINVATLASCGNVYPTFAGIASRDPYIEVSLYEADYTNTFGLNGTAQSSTDSTVYLAKIDENGTRVADGTAEHIKFTLDDGLITVSEVGGSNNEPSLVTIRHTTTYDGSNAVWVIAAASEIT